MVSYSQIEKGLAAWLDGELLPKMPLGGQYDPLKKVAVATGALYMLKNGRRIINPYMPQLVQIGFADEGGAFDLDGIKDIFKAQMPDGGLRVPLPIVNELTFYKPDIDTIYSYIMGVRE